MTANFAAGFPPRIWAANNGPEMHCQAHKLEKNFSANEELETEKSKKAGNEQGSGTTVTISSGPPSLRKVRMKHREVLNIPWTPSETGADVTQNGYPRQCESANPFEMQFRAASAINGNARAVIALSCEQQRPCARKDLWYAPAVPPPLIHFQGFHTH
jgi:hypothetical protein